eukprot:673048-Pyramimonas_sp.AAC.1
MVKWALRRGAGQVRVRPALHGHVVKQMISAAEAEGKHELADAFAVARGFLFRAGAELVPLMHG